MSSSFIVLNGPAKGEVARSPYSDHRHGDRLNVFIPGEAGAVIEAGEEVGRRYTQVEVRLYVGPDNGWGRARRFACVEPDTTEREGRRLACEYYGWKMSND